MSNTDLRLGPDDYVQISVEVDYFEWLRDVIHMYEPAYEHYSALIKMMYDLEYHYTLQVDDDRSVDGKTLRNIYARETGDKYIHYWNGSCSVLEMLVALSVRADKDITGVPDNDGSFVWFWTFVENLGLMEYDDSHFDPDAVCQIIDDWMERRYQKNGFGGLFPVQNESGRDQRNLSTWQQLCQYIMETTFGGDE